jgi:hypothetical protein
MSVFEKVVRLHTLYPRWPSGAPVLDANLTGTTGAAGVAGRNCGRPRARQGTRRICFGEKREDR